MSPATGDAPDNHDHVAPHQEKVEHPTVDPDERKDPDQEYLAPSEDAVDQNYLSPSADYYSQENYLTPLTPTDTDTDQEYLTPYDDSQLPENLEVITSD